jgi:hypothetical protein
MKLDLPRDVIMHSEAMNSIEQFRGKELSDLSSSAPDDKLQMTKPFNPSKGDFPSPLSISFYNWVKSDSQSAPLAIMAGALYLTSHEAVLSASHVTPLIRLTPRERHFQLCLKTSGKT